MRQWLDPGPKHSPQLPWQERQVAFDEENSDDLDNRRNVAQCYFLTWFGKKLNWKNQASYWLNVALKVEIIIIGFLFNAWKPAGGDTGAKVR